MAHVFASDDMAAAAGVLLHNHVPDVGTAWIRHPWYKSPNQAATVNWRSDGDGFYPTVFGAMYIQDEPLSAEYDVEVDCTIIDDYGNAGIIARASTTIRTFYHFYHQSGQFHLIRHVNGLTTNLFSAPDDGVTGTFTMKAEIRDATKKLYVDDNLVFTSTDNTIKTKGVVGLRSAFQYGDNEGKQFTNFVATDTADPVGRPARAIWI